MRLPGSLARDSAADAVGCFVTIELENHLASGGDSLARRVAEILSIVDEISTAKVTFFAAAEVAQQQADFLAGLARGGHEIGWLGKLEDGIQPDQVKTLRDVTGQPVVGFRFIAGASQPVAFIAGASQPVAFIAGASQPVAQRQLETLVAAGIRYDSGTAGKARRSAEHPYDEIAVAGGPFFAFPVQHQILPGGAPARIIGATFLRAMPVPILLRMLRRGTASGYAPTLYLRPGDLDAQLEPLDFRDVLGAGRLSRWTLGRRQHPRTLEDASPAWKLREILRNFPPRGRLCDALPAEITT